jgi:transposase-like protein
LGFSTEGAEPKLRRQIVDKFIYLALNNISQKWTMPMRDWKAALNRFTIQFDERMPRV